MRTRYTTCYPWAALLFRHPILSCGRYETHKVFITNRQFVAKRRDYIQNPGTNCWQFGLRGMGRTVWKTASNFSRTPNWPQIPSYPNHNIPPTQDGPLHLAGYSLSQQRPTLYLHPGSFATCEYSSLRRCIIIGRNWWSWRTGILPHSSHWLNSTYQTMSRLGILPQRSDSMDWVVGCFCGVVPFWT